MARIRLRERRVSVGRAVRIGPLRAIREERRLSPGAYAQQSGEPAWQRQLSRASAGVGGVVEVMGTANRRGAEE